MLDEFVDHVQEMADSTLCVCGHRADDHSRDDNIDNPDPGEPCHKCECYTFRPTFYRDGEASVIPPAFEDKDWDAVARIAADPRYSDEYAGIIFRHYIHELRRRQGL